MGDDVMAGGGLYVAREQGGEWQHVGYIDGPIRLSSDDDGPGWEGCEPRTLMTSWTGTIELRMPHPGRVRRRILGVIFGMRRHRFVGRYVRERKGHPRCRRK